MSDDALYRKLDVGNVRELIAPDDEVPLTRLGDLICAAHSRFSSWTLVPWFYADNDRRGQFRLTVIRSQNWRGAEPTSDPDHLEELRKVELSELCEFIRGFAAGTSPGAAAEYLERRRKMKG